MSDPRINKDRCDLRDYRLKVHHSQYIGKFPSFQKPSIHGYFSLDSERCYCPNLNQLKYISIPHDLSQVNFDLNNRISEAIQKDDDADEKLDNILKWILQNTKTLKLIDSSSFPEVVCYRGLLTLLMCTPYERQEGWVINATKWKGLVYLCASDTEEKRRQKKQATPRQKQCSSWGYKFEQYMSSESPGGELNIEEPVNENEEFCVIFRTKLNSHRLLYGAEMDGIISKAQIKHLSELQNAEFIELKTNRVIEYDKQHQNFVRYKLIKWWGQSFLVGISRLLCGFRDDHGMVLDVEEFRVPDLCRMAKGAWDATVCMNFCDNFLTFVKSVVKEEDPQTVWKFEWQPNTDVTVTKVNDPTQFSILPKWFTDNMI